MVHLIAEQRRDGEIESMHPRKKMTGLIIKNKLVSITCMDELRFLDKGKRTKLANF